MPDTIKDGKGRGYLASVNSDNQVVCRSTSVEQRLVSTVDETYFEATTGKFTLSNAGETGSIYFSNTRSV